MHSDLYRIIFWKYLLQEMWLRAGPLFETAAYQHLMRFAMHSFIMPKMTRISHWQSSLNKLLREASVSYATQYDREGNQFARVDHYPGQYEEHTDVTYYQTWDYRNRLLYSGTGYNYTSNTSRYDPLDRRLYSEISAYADSP